jgi:hypothetical protein
MPGYDDLVSPSDKFALYGAHLSEDKLVHCWEKYRVGALCFPD